MSMRRHPLDEPWIHVLLAFVVMFVLYWGVSIIIQLLGGPTQ